MTGPLAGVRILEIAGIGPGPFAATVLAGLGADVIRLHRPGDAAPIAAAGLDADKAGRPSIAADLKTAKGRALVQLLAGRADALIESFRPGVMERLGLGPTDLLAVNRRLVYCRMTGYGQHGPLAAAPGHDINYLAISGVLDLIGRRGERPVPPLNLLADYGGGGMLLALGLVAGVLEARQTGRGTIVDAAMVDGVAQLATMFFSFSASGSWGPRGTNFLDTGAHFYEVYDTADGGHVAVGAVEPHFYAKLVEGLGLRPQEAPQWESDRWPELKLRFAEIFGARGRDYWVEHLHDACVTPVLTLAEAAVHPHARARASFARGLPVTAPRFGDRPSAPPRPAGAAGRWGLADGEVEELT